MSFPYPVEFHGYCYKHEIVETHGDPNLCKHCLKTDAEILKEKQSDD